MGLDLLMLKIWVLSVKGQQSYQPLNFENSWTPGELESGLNALAHNLAGMTEVADFFLRTPTLTASNFDALWLTDPKFLALKDLYSLKKYDKYQESSYNFRLGFALSNRPHLHRASLVMLCTFFVTAVWFLQKYSEALKHIAFLRSSHVQNTSIC